MNGRSSLLLSAFVLTSVWASVLVKPSFAEFQVNTSSNVHERGVVALSDSKGFVVAWGNKTLKNVLAQRYDGAGNAIGAEFQVVSTTDDEKEASVAMTSTGVFAVAWTNATQKDVYVQLYDAGGSAVAQALVTPPAPEANFGFETIFASSQGTVKEKQIATQIVLTEAVTVTSITAYIEGNGGSVRYAIYSDKNDEPRKLKAETASTIVPAGWAWRTIDLPDVALKAGKYWLALAFDQDTQQYKFDATGGQTRVVNHDAVLKNYRGTWGGSSESNTRKISIYATYVPKTDDKSPSVSMANDGSLVVAWENKTAKDIFVQRYDAAGIAVGAVIQVTSSADTETVPRVVMADDGSFVVAWGNTTSKDVFAQRYDSGGSPLGAAIQVTSSVNDEKAPRIAMAQNGAFVVVWENKTTKDVYAQRYDSLGNAIGGAIQVTTSPDDEKRQSVSMDDDGAFVVTWKNNTSKDVYLQLYDQNGNAMGVATQVTTSTNPDKRPSIAMNALGRYVVVWSNKIDKNTENIFGQLYNSDGSSTGVWANGLRIMKWIEIR